MNKPHFLFVFPLVFLVISSICFAEEWTSSSIAFETTGDFNLKFEPRNVSSKDLGSFHKIRCADKGVSFVLEFNKRSNGEGSFLYKGVNLVIHKGVEKYQAIRGSFEIIEETSKYYRGKFSCNLRKAGDFGSKLEIKDGVFFALKNRY